MSDHGGCRIGNVDRAPVVGPCRVDCGHRAWVLAARETLALAAEARKLRREEALRGARTDGEEGRDFDRHDPPLTLKDVMVDQRRAREHDEAVA